jgi:arsenate reductase
MADVTIYHNPRCSKSRKTLAILEEKGIEAEVVLYLENPLDQSEIRELLEKLELSAGQLVRKGEDEYMGQAQLILPLAIYMWRHV